MQQAQTGLVLHRLGRTNEAQRIMERIRQQAITSSEEGMFWGKEYNGRYYRWYQAPIERQAVLIEAFNIISPKKQELDQMKQWLLMQKHQQGWSNTKATAEAIFALMMGDASVLNTESNTTLRVGDARFVPERKPLRFPAPAISRNRGQRATSHQDWRRLPLPPTRLISYSGPATGSTWKISARYPNPPRGYASSGCCTTRYEVRKDYNWCP